MDRIEKISKEMQKVISMIIRDEIKDPRVPLLTSVISVDVAKDLKYAKVYISILGNSDEKKNCMIALSKSAGFIRHVIGEKMIIRYVPELTFKLDETIEKGAYMSALIDKAVKNDSNKIKQSDDNDKNKN